MSPTTVTLANVSQVHHLVGLHGSPRIRTNAHLGAKAAFTEAHTIHRLRMEIIGNKFVVSLERLVGDVEVNGAIFIFGALAQNANRFLVTVNQRWNQIADER